MLSVWADAAPDTQHANTIHRALLIMCVASIEDVTGPP
jgi:hypothetical protein